VRSRLRASTDAAEREYAGFERGFMDSVDQRLYVERFAEVGGLLDVQVRH
jgi:hypothetical protein